MAIIRFAIVVVMFSMLAMSRTKLLMINGGSVAIATDTMTMKSYGIGFWSITTVKDGTNEQTSTHRKTKRRYIP